MRRVLVASLVLALLLSVSNCVCGQDKMTVDDVYDIQINPGDNYIQELQEVIQDKGQDAYTRETAVLVLADISMNKSETHKVVDFLKDIAANETEEDVRTAAYAALDLIGDAYPPEPKGTLDLKIAGDIRKGADVTLVVTVTSAVDIESLVAVSRLHEDIQAVTQPIVRVNLKANVPQDVEFGLHLGGLGEFFIRVTSTLSFDLTESEVLGKRIYILVGEQSGEVLFVAED